MIVFQKVPGIDYKADECWINDNPQGLWSRVAVVSMWTPLARTRKSWGDQPAVIGMLRTIPGIDLLVRGLLANPQIRVVVIDGTDASADKATSKALRCLWDENTGLDIRDRNRVLGDDLHRISTTWDLFRDVKLLDVKDGWRLDGSDDGLRMTLTAPQSIQLPIGFDFCPNADRPGGAVILPPPPPKANAPAPHGDPGERVAGDTLADVWPVILQRVMAFGRPVPTQYGSTRELLNLVSVVRDPAKSVEEIKNGTSSSDLREVWEAMGAFVRGEVAMGGIFGSISTTDAAAKEPLPEIPHRILGLTYTQVKDYARQFLDPVPPGGDGTAYAYGARLRGAATDVPQLPGASYVGECPADAVWTLENAVAYVRAVQPSAMDAGWCLMLAGGVLNRGGSRTDLDLLAYPRTPRADRAALLALLPPITWSKTGVSDVAAYSVSTGRVELIFQTPIAPDQIAAVHKLLTDTPNTRAAFLTTWRPEDSGVESGRPCLVGVTFRAVPIEYPDGTIDAAEAEGKRDLLLAYALHMTVTFRSHDMHGAYPLNIAALCLWLCEEAKSLGMAVGTLTCVSQSAHVYERDYNAANAKVEAHRWPAIEWDQRSTWRVEVVSDPCPMCNGVKVVPDDEPWFAYCEGGDGKCENGKIPGALRWSESEDVCGWFCDEHRVGEIDESAGINGGPQPHFDRCPTCGPDTCDPAGGTGIVKGSKRIRAVCLTPDGNKVTRVFEGKTASGLLQEIERSGLVSSVGNAMWLGGELVKAETKL